MIFWRWPMISGDGWGLNFSRHLSYSWGKTLEKNLNQENWPDQGSNLGPLGERQQYYPSTTAMVHKILAYVSITGIGSLVLSEVSRWRRCRGSKYIPLPQCLHLQSILIDQGRTLLAYLLRNMSATAGKETYISRIVGGEEFLLCTRWQCKMFVVLDS